MIGSLMYLYVGTAGVDADLALYRDALGGEVVWRFRAMGADVCAVRLGEGPLVILADHRPAPSVLPIFAVDSLKAVSQALRVVGWSGSETTVEVPDGPCLVLVDPSGNEVAFLHRVRPDAMTHSYRDPANDSAVR